jgi:hypothetical protein
VARSTARARIVAAEMSKTLGQQVIVANKRRRCGTLGADFVAKAQPDGYTLCWCPTGPLTITPLSDPKVPYQPLTDLAPVSHAINMDNVIMTRKDLPAGSLKEMIARSKADPKGYTFGTPGAGGTHHLGAEWFQDETGANSCTSLQGREPQWPICSAPDRPGLGSAALAAPLATRHDQGDRQPRHRALGTAARCPHRVRVRLCQLRVVQLRRRQCARGDAGGGHRHVVEAVAQAVRSPTVKDKFVALGFQSRRQHPERIRRLPAQPDRNRGRLLKKTTLTRD